METIHDLEASFRRVAAKAHLRTIAISNRTPHQSKGRLVRFPGSSLAAADLGVSRQHLHRVLIGERQSASLISRWHAWLKHHPEFAAIQPRH